MSETTTSEAPQLLLEHHLKTLRLPTMLREYDRVARQCAVEDIDYPHYLLRMTELELLDRERRATERRIRQARFPVTKSLDSFDFLAMPTLNKAMVLELARCEFLQRKENVLLLGNSGTGKTHIALALGLVACQGGHRVRFTTASALVSELIEARDEKKRKRGVWATCTSCTSVVKMFCMVDIELSVGAGPLPRRRRRTAEELRIVEEALEAGASVARVARKHGVNANQVFAWSRLYESGRLGAPASGMKLLPVRVVEEHAPVKEAVAEIAPLQAGTIHIELPGRALISLEGSVDPAMIRAVLRSLGA